MSAAGLSFDTATSRTGEFLVDDDDEDEDAIRDLTALMFDTSVEAR